MSPLTGGAASEARAGTCGPGYPTLREALDEGERKGEQTILSGLFAERAGRAPTRDEQEARVKRAQDLGAQEAVRPLLKLDGVGASTVTTGSAATAATVSPRTATAIVGAGAGDGAADAATATDAVAEDAAVGDADVDGASGDEDADTDADGAPAHGFRFAPGGGPAGK